jgi:hypothetical protein
LQGDTKTDIMHRRSAIRCFLAGSAGIILLPACLHDQRKSSVIWKNISLTGEQEDMLADLAETVIPRTDTPGAKDISAHLFAMTMLDDCYDRAAQAKFMNGLAQFEALARDRYSHSFVDCSLAQKQELVGSIEKGSGVSTDVWSFYQTMKKLTIQSFVSSSFFLTKVHVYEMVPSRFHGCVPVGKANA